MLVFHNYISRHSVLTEVACFTVHATFEVTDSVLVYSLYLKLNCVAYDCNE